MNIYAPGKTYTLKWKQSKYVTCRTPCEPKSSKLYIFVRPKVNPSCISFQSKASRNSLIWYNKRAVIKVIDVAIIQLSNKITGYLIITKLKSNTHIKVIFQNFNTKWSLKLENDSGGTRDKEEKYSSISCFVKSSPIYIPVWRLIGPSSTVISITRIESVNC